MDMGINDRKQKEKQIRKEDILDAAEKVFFSKGYDKATMDEVAKEAEFTKKTLYAYFATKDEILYEVMLRGFIKLNQMIDEGLANNRDKHSIESIISMGYKFYEFGVQFPGYFRIIIDYENRAYDFMDGKDNPVIRECYTKGQYSFERLQELVQQGLEAGDIETGNDAMALSLLLWANLQGLLMLLFKKREFIDAQFHMTTESILKIWFDMLLKLVKK